MAHPDYHYFQLSFDKRPEEELFDMEADPDCIENLAAQLGYAAVKRQLWSQLKTELTAQGDPRMLDGGDIFDYYPNRSIERQQTLYNRPDFDPIKQFDTKFGLGTKP